MRKALLFVLMLFSMAVPAQAQVTITYSFTAGTIIDPDQMNANFTALGAAALNRTGGTVTGALTSSGGSLAGTWTGTPTISSAWTFSGAPVFSGAASFTGAPVFSGAAVLSGAAVHSGNSTVTGTMTFDSDAIHIFDTNASHDLIITPGSDLTADRVLTLTTGDAARTVTLSGNPTLSDWFDQSVKVAASPTFNALTVSSCTGCGSISLTAVRVYTAGATWSKPAGLSYVVVQVVGGGGGGGGSGATGGSQVSIAAGGSGGGGSLKRIAAASLGATETVTVGAAGGGGSAGANNGSAGGTSSFGTHLSATGGAGGPGDAAGATDRIQATATLSPGVGSNGDVNVTGSPGERGISVSIVYAQGGHGGDSAFGFGGGGDSSDDIAGENATGFGGGGGGSSDTQNSAARAGGNGTPGLVIVYEYGS